MYTICDFLDINIRNDLLLFPNAGKIERDQKLDYIISVNPLDSPTRQRFTIAHEIAHFVLHKGRIGDGIVDDPLYQSGLSNSEESEANAMAADLVMPVKFIKERLPQLREEGKDIDTIASILADEFEVSPLAMRIRLGLE